MKGEKMSKNKVKIENKNGNKFNSENKRLNWIVSMFNRYLAETGKENVWTRKLHYFIVSLPADQRKIPRWSGERVYENTPSDYKTLCDLLAEARIAGLIDPDKIIDQKNEPLLESPEERQADFNFICNVTNPGYLSEYCISEEMPGFEVFFDKIETEAEYTNCQFAHQDYRIAVVTEKSSLKEVLTPLCKKYGADLIIFSGNLSVTRVYDLALRAKAENKPVLILYICDLDCAGWTMPGAFYDRLNAIYPNPKNRPIRVALDRQQAIKYHLPASFEADDKKYKKAVKERFIRESGGSECIELDALPEDILVELLEEHLKTYSRVDLDEEKNKKMREIVDSEINSINLLIKSELREFEKEYNDLQKDFNELVKKIKNFFAENAEKAQILKEQQDNLIQKIKDKINANISAFKTKIKAEMEESNKI